MRRFLIGLCCLFLLAGGAAAAPVFPALAGRVVDEAHLLSPAEARALSVKLADYEAGTSTQLVVVTVPSLDGEPIEQYGVELGRHWGIGQKGANNGALLIVAPKEHAVRIEVGYGLEGVLTDAQSSMIINQIMLPEFRDNQPDRAIIDGTKAVMLVLGGKSVHVSAPAQQRSQLNVTEMEILVLMICGVLFIVFACYYPNAAEFLVRIAFYMVISGGGERGNGGGFSGGGGSFGGGGASGRW